MDQMVGPVKRPYNASRRQEQARRNRAQVLDAARRRFLTDGYAATTLAAIARDADVSVDTIYKTFRNKPGLLKAVFDVAVAGDDEPIAMSDRSSITEIRAEPDARRKLELYAAHLAETMPRAAPVQLLARAAAATDPDIDALHEQTRT